MNLKRHSSALIVAAVFMLALLVLLPSDILLSQDSVSSYVSSYGQEYLLVRGSNGELRAQVNVDLQDKASRDLYAKQQRETALLLAQESEAESLLMQLTFAQPLNTEEYEELIHGTGMSPEVALFEARDEDGGLHTVAVRADEGIDLSSLPPIVGGPTLNVMGMTAVKGNVPTAQVAAVANDERIYLPDANPYVLATELVEQQGMRLEADTEQVRSSSGQVVDIYVPSPHWILSNEREVDKEMQGIYTIEQAMFEVYLPITSN